MPDDLKKLSKFLSYVLRHRPDEIGLVLDANGWADVSDLIERAKRAGTHLTEELIGELVRPSDKQRFALSDDGARIRANQGHSVSVDLALEAKEPPEMLFHGTATRFIDGIQREGLRPMSRQHVHLSPDEETATKVGQRHGKPVVLHIKSGEMHRAGRKFYLSEKRCLADRARGCRIHWLPRVTNRIRRARRCRSRRLATITKYPANVRQMHAPITDATGRCESQLMNGPAAKTSAKITAAFPSARRVLQKRRFRIGMGCPKRGHRSAR